MFEKNRKYLRCIFCFCEFSSNNKRSKEHIFGMAIAKKFPNMPDWKVDFGSSHLEEPRKIVNGGGKILSVAPQLACESCNGNELKATLDNSLQTLNLLFDACPFNFDLEIQHHLKRYLERIAIIMDVTNSNLDISEKRKKLKSIY